MKNPFKHFRLAAFLLLPFFASAQEEYSGTEMLVLDLLTISDKFATPGAEAAMHQSSAGWYTSAKPLDLWEVDISVHANFVFIPEKRKTVSISNSEFHTLSIRDGVETAVIPTALGGDTEVFFEGEFLGSPFEFQALEGVKKDNVFYPFLQASIGLPYETSFTVRYLPLTEIKDVEYHVAGAAVQHNISQYFYEESSRDIQLSALVAYSSIGVFYLFDPLELPGVALNKIKINGNLWEAQFIASKDFGDYFEVFSALGATTASFNYEVGGEGQEFIGALNQAYERLNDSEALVKGDVGFNIQYKNFTLNSVFSIGQYLNYNVGLHYKI